MNPHFLKVRFSPALVNALIALAVAMGVVTYFYFAKFSGNITGFFRIGSVLPLSPYLDPQTTLVWPEELGYDGQQFLSIALDPFLSDQGTIAALDHPLYRYRRIFYPFLGYILGLGNATLIPYALVGINLLAIAWIIFFLSHYLNSYKIHNLQALWGLTIPGLWMVLSLSTADILAAAFSLAALYADRRHNPWQTSIFIAFGLLTRETLLLVWLAIFLNNLKLKKYNYLLPLSLALVPLGCWTLYIGSLNLSGANGGGNFGFPLGGVLAKGGDLIQRGLTSSTLYEGYSFLLLILTFIITLYFIFYKRYYNQASTVIIFLYLGLFIVSSIYILNYYLNYSRVFIDIYVVGLLILLQTSFGTDNLILKRAKLSLFSAWGLASLTFIFLQS